MRLSCLLPFCLAIVATSHAADYSCRWVYVSRGLHKDQDVEDIMYTTWQNKYALLAPFGGLVSRNSPQ